jgi:hypothetical protein
LAASDGIGEGTFEQDLREYGFGPDPQTLAHEPGSGENKE